MKSPGLNQLTESSTKFLWKPKVSVPLGLPAISGDHDTPDPVNAGTIEVGRQTTTEPH